ncbi:MAG: PAS/PAC sensor signal transduction histidine kinase [Promethearchaeota archaeon CR_4]|nr:MAG: PAS/PAC sensor signal transduction histidine kinase [Candidatus Lokiarchaeota archaeon CR_4]
MMDLRSDPPLTESSLWEAIFDKTSDSILLVDVRSGKILKANRPSELLLGKPQNSIIGTSISSLLLPAEGYKSVGHDAIAQSLPAAQARLQKAIKDCISKGEFQEVECELGEDRRMRACIFPVNSKGQINNLILILADITEWKKKEKALKASEEKYRKLYMKSPGMLESIDGEGYIVSVNDTWLEKMGYTLDEVIGHRYTKFFTRASKEYALSTSTPEFLKTGEFKNRNFQLVKKNGDLMDVLVTIISERDESGKIVGILDFITDVTELKKAEGILKASEEKYRNLYMKAPAMLESIDPKGIILSVNDIWLKKLGYTREEVLGHRYDEFLAPASIDRVKKYTEYQKTHVIPTNTGVDIQAHGEINFQVVKKNGEILDTMISAFSVRDDSGKVVQIIEMINDITARKRAEEALRRSEEKYRTLFESNVVGVALSDREGVIHECNRAIAAIFGYTEEEFLHVSVPALYANSKDRELFLSMIEKTGEVGNFETVMRKKDGTSIWVLFSAKRIPLEDKELFLVTLINIDQIKQAMQVVKDSHNSLLKLYEDALSISDMKTNLITFASHELKTPLVPIIGWAEFMAQTINKGKKLDEIIGMEEVASILQSARRLTTIINNFLDVGRIESKRLELKMGKHKTTILMKNAVDSVAQLALSHNIAINNHIQDFDIWVDGFRIEQVFINILSNAIKYSPEGTQVTVTLEVNGNQISIFFKDQGYGFTPEQLGEVWRPFSSKSMQSKDNTLPGTGIGLFLTRGLIERHNGTIEISSPGPNLGSTVKITLPMNLLRNGETSSPEDKKRDQG